MNFLFFISFAILSSCSNRYLIKTARMDFTHGVACLDTLRARMQEAGCDQIQVEHRGDTTKGEAEEILMRCYKDAGKRGKFWDNYIFRLSHAELDFADDSIKQIEKHTICIDKKIRIEAYAP